MRIFPLILCGGSGTRLWPSSSPARPKQFIALLGDRSMFQDTVLRAAPLGAVAVVAGEAHVSAIRGQLAAVGVEAAILVEPEARDSGPAVAAAAAWVTTQDPDGVGVMLASDHYVGDDEAFRASVRVAAQAAEAGRIVTFGVRPTEPSEAYGYILPTPPSGGEAVTPVVRFVEKPKADVARGYVAEGYLWNSGNFVFGAAVLLSELDAHSPEMARAARAAVDEAQADGEVLRLGPSFRQAPKLSIDYAVMEKTDRSSVTAVSFPWSDLGAWDAVHAVSALDADCNAGPESAVFLNTRGAFVRAPTGVTVALSGVSDLAVVVEGSSVLVCDLKASQSVKALSQLVKTGPPPAPALGTLSAQLQHWLSTAALPLWWTLGADHVGGGFREALSLDGRPVEGPARARVQARQTQVYAQAALDGWSGPGEAAARHGLNGFVAGYRRADGAFATAPGSQTVTVYDQAFALFSLAAADAVLGERAEALALEVLVALQGRRHRAGGYVETDEHPFQSNPHMHLLEAALAWEDRRPGDDRWLDLADEAAGLALTRFIDAESGALREFFDADWRPAEGPPGRRVEPGHQFEWAWLLARWSRRRSRPEALSAARRLYEIGSTYGVDAGRGVAVDALSDDFTVIEPRARLWPQTERLKAALILDDEAGAAAAGAAMLRYLDVPTLGAWRDKMRPDGGFVEEPAPASSFYHLAAAVRELRLYTEARAQT